MAFIDDVRFSLRISITTNSQLNDEIQRWINEAVLDLTNTSDIRGFSIETADALLKGAVIDYCHFKYEADPTVKRFYKESYDSAKTQLLMSSVYSNVGGVPYEDS